MQDGGEIRRPLIEAPSCGRGAWPQLGHVTSLHLFYTGVKWSTDLKATSRVIVLHFLLHLSPQH
jgi:hypothetical protein